MISREKPTVFILSISSDIGLFLARKYLERGCRVIGTYRSPEALVELKALKGCELFQCDISRKDNVDELVQSLKRLNVQWHTFISCVGYLLPVKPFFNASFEEWEQSVLINSIDQLRVLHKLYPFCDQSKTANVVFFAGGGANNVTISMSAYAAAKILLMKMCEHLDVENSNMKFFMVGPGWTKTKLHEVILKTPGVDQHKYQQTKEFMETKQGTALQEICECIDWLCEQEKSVVSGRNFSVVHDPWRIESREDLLQALKAEPEMYKLRRYNNDFLQNIESVYGEVQKIKPARSV